MKKIRLINIILLLVLTKSCSTSKTTQNPERFNSEILELIIKELDNKEEFTVYNLLIENKEHCEYKMWIDTSKYRYVTDYLNGKYIFDKDNYYESLSGDKSLRVNRENFIAQIKKIQTFDKNFKYSKTVNFTNNFNEKGVLVMTPIIRTNKRNVFISLVTILSKTNLIQYGFTIKIKKNRLEVNDMRYYDWCHLENNIN